MKTTGQLVDHPQPGKAWVQVPHRNDIGSDWIEIDVPVNDHHCATCQCAGTECRENEWCKRTWGHRDSCSVIRDEEFSR